ncbi:hypothetical protein NOVA_14425 [Nocardia nova]|uniref:hypothetical protein n=1 Tax=Nocardia nova TaxID=37330 RepID=UPI001C4637B9|nr:hypothetical protein [Nocardia nova]MBV7703973.1 hypothetical protein [Nocardia nova]
MAGHHPRSRRRLLGISAVVVVILAAAVLAYLVLAPRTGHTDRSSSPPFPSEMTTPPPGTEPFDGDRAAEMNTELTSPNPESFQQAVAVPSGVSIPQTAIAAVAAIAPLDFDLQTNRYLGSDAAVTIAHAHHDHSTAWRVYLILYQGEWKIAATERQQ